MDPLSAVATAIGAGDVIGGAIGSALPTHRQCTIDVTNNCPNYTLHDASVYTQSGSCNDYQTTIAPSDTGRSLFTKTPHAARGSVGVITYELLENSTGKASERMAVMFSVPYDFNLYSNWFAVGVFEADRKCDYDLYCKMYYESGGAFTRGKAKDGRLTHKGKKVTVTARMTDTYQPIIKVQVSRK